MNLVAPIADSETDIFSASILVVDDHEINRLFLNKILIGNGFRNILSADNAVQAIEVIEHFNPDIILLDILMPGGMDGFQLCAYLRRLPHYQDMPILVQTSITEPELRAKAFACGATDFVSKPVFPDELCARVKVHLQNRKAMRALQHYKLRMDMEMECARQLQLSILPSEPEIAAIEQSCHIRTASSFEPSIEIGGDFWGLKNLFPHQAALWLVDFSGHGVASALNAFRLQAYLKDHSLCAARPGEYLSQLNDKLLALLTRGQFATMFYGIIDTHSRQLFYSCACSTHPILYRHKTGKAALLDGSGKPLGIGMTIFDTQTIDFMPGDILLLYSDALIETRGEDGHVLTEEDLTQIIEQSAGADCKTLNAIILSAYHTVAGTGLRDDLTIVICQAAPP